MIDDLQPHVRVLGGENLVERHAVGQRRGLRIVDPPDEQRRHRQQHFLPEAIVQRRLVGVELRPQRLAGASLHLRDCRLRLRRVRHRDGRHEVLVGERLRRIRLVREDAHLALPVLVGRGRALREEPLVDLRVQIRRRGGRVHHHKRLDDLRMPDRQQPRQARTARLPHQVHLPQLHRLDEAVHVLDFTLDVEVLVVLRIVGHPRCQLVGGEHVDFVASPSMFALQTLAL